MTSKLKCPYSEEELKEIRNNFNGNKLVCPFCGRKLGRKNINDRMCSNEKCENQDDKALKTLREVQNIIRKVNIDSDPTVTLMEIDALIFHRMGEL